MMQDDIPIDNSNCQPELQSNGNGSGNGRRSTRVGSGDNGDDDSKRFCLTPERWTQIQDDRSKKGESMSIILSRLGLASENQVKHALELQYGINYLPLSKIEHLDLECMRLLPEEVMRLHQIAPVLKDGNRVSIAMVNPNDLVALDDIKTRLRGTQVKLFVWTEEDFQGFMESVYAKLMTP